MAKRKDLGGNTTVSVYVSEMESIASSTRASKPAKAFEDTIRALQMARIIRRMTLGSETRERLRPAFLAMVKRLGGVTNNKRFTTAQRAELLGAGRQALAKLPAEARTQPPEQAGAHPPM